MIAELPPGGREIFLRGCAAHPVMGVHLRADLDVFRESGSHCRFWVILDAAGQPAGALSLQRGRLTAVAGEACDRAELRDALPRLGRWWELFAPWELCEQMVPPGAIGDTQGPIMVYRDPYHAPGGIGKMPIVESISPREIKGLLSKSDDAILSQRNRQWDAWYAYTSHQFRHDLAFAAGIYQNGQLVSTAGVYAMDETTGVIANVATRPRHRGQGFASQLVSHLVGKLLSQGRTPALLCADDGLAAYYGRLGFIHHSRWGKVETGGDI